MALPGIINTGSSGTTGSSVSTGQVLQFKRRNSGAAGAPAALKSGEPAYNAVDGKLYIGHGDDGNGNATEIKVIADVTKLQQAATTGDLAAAISAIGFASLAGFSADDVARLSGAAFTVTPTAPTPASTDNSTKLATTAFVHSAAAAKVAEIVDAAPETMNTLKELADEIQQNDTVLDGLNASVGNKLSKASNLSDLADVAAARTNLGLGTLATQAADSVNIPGGTIGAGVTIAAPIDGGTF